MVSSSAYEYVFIFSMTDFYFNLFSKLVIGRLYVRNCASVMSKYTRLKLEDTNCKSCPPDTIRFRQKNVDTAGTGTHTRNDSYYSKYEMFLTKAYDIRGHGLRFVSPSFKRARIWEYSQTCVSCECQNSTIYFRWTLTTNGGNPIQYMYN